MSSETGRMWKYIGIVFIIITIILAVIAFYQYTNYQSLNSEYSSLSSKYAEISKSYNETLVANLAYDHWIAISSNDINSLMSQYSSNAIVYWFKGPLAGNYTMTSVVKGPTHAVPEAKDIKTLWLAFFNNKPAILKIANLTVNIIGHTASVKAQVSFIFTGGPRSGTVLNINYELTYSYVNGKWVLYDEWWIPK